MRKGYHGRDWSRSPFWDPCLGELALTLAAFSGTLGDKSEPLRVWRDSDLVCADGGGWGGSCAYRAAASSASLSNSHQTGRLLRDTGGEDFCTC